MKWYKKQLGSSDSVLAMLNYIGANGVTQDRIIVSDYVVYYLNDKEL